MKLVIVAVLAVAAVALAAPPVSQLNAASAQTLRSDFQQQPEGSYIFSFETDNGISRSENGELKQVADEENKPHDVVVVRGQYSWTDDLGQGHSLTYTADENGYHPEGDDIPKQA